MSELPPSWDHAIGSLQTWVGQLALIAFGVAFLLWASWFMAIAKRRSIRRKEEGRG